MRIYIPTQGRIFKQKTVDRFGPDLCKEFRVTLVTPPGEANELKDATRGQGVEVLVCPVPGIAGTRQAILQHARRPKGDPILLMLDDDLSTWRQRGEIDDGGDARYHRATVDEIRTGLLEFEELMQNHAHGSIGHALFCQTSPELKFNSRMLRALAYNIKLMPKNIEFRLKVMEDFDIALQLLTTGHPSVTYNRIVQDQHQNNSEGGCSVYRTDEVQAQAAHDLAALWPDYVTVVTRAPKREWIGMPVRTDVRVNWAKAAKAGGLK